MAASMTQFAPHMNRLQGIKHNGQPSTRIQVREICQRLQLGRRAVYALLEARIIPSIRVGTRYLIGRHAYEETEKYIGEHRTNVVPAHREHQPTGEVLNKQ